MIKVVVFDFDDTLVQGTEAKKQAAFWEIFDGAPEARAYAAAHRGAPRREMIRGILTALEKDESELDKYLAVYAARTEAAQIGAPAMPGAVEALEKLSKTHRLYLNSATPQDSIERTVAGRGWGKFFHGVYGSPPGTKTENLGRVLKSVRIRGMEVVAVGNGASDLTAALKWGCHFIGTYSEFSSLESSGSFPVLTDLTRLVEEILRFG